jgi:hypothetical protein
MNFDIIKTNNFELFLDGISTGNIPVGQLGGNLQVGAGQPNPTITSFTGGPYLPVANALPKNLAGMSYGATGNYSRPFLSVSQYLNNGTYNYVGVYARLVRYKREFTSTCIDSNCEDTQGDNVSKQIWGRVGTILSGLYSGQLGFYAQDWYNVDDGTYDAAFWTTHYEPDIDPPIPNKQQWWNQCSKATVRVRFVNDPLRSFADVEVALNNVSSTSPQYYQAEDLSVFNLGSVQLYNLLQSVVTSLWI